MKKFVFIMAALLVSVLASAQTVESSRTFENTYIGISGGAISPFMVNNSFVKDLRPIAGIEFGKDFTPVIGISVEGLAAFNTTGAYTVVDQSNVAGNFKVNLSNWFGGYKGQPRRIEFLAVPSLGWGHNFVSNAPDENYLTFNPHAQINVNMGKARALQLNVKAGASWRTNEGADWLYKNNGAATVRIGLTYKFGSKRKHSHNFVLCPYSVTKADYDAALATIDSLRKAAPVKEVVKETVIKEKETIVEKEVVKPANTIITFDMGSSTLKAVEMAKLKNYAAQLTDKDTVLVTGSADSATGSAQRNQTLATERAKVVADALADMGVKNVQTSTQLDTNENAEASRAAVVVVK